MECSPDRAKVPRSYIVAYFVYIILSFGVLQVVEFIYVKFVSRTYICMLVAIA